MKHSAVRDAAITGGWRSGLEEKVGEQLEQECIAAKYEPCRLQYTRPSERATYTPDFILPNGIIIETKGRFVTADRKKHKLLKAQEPDLDIRFVFSYSRSKLGKKSATTYAMWCDQHGFEYADKLIPHEWLCEPTNRASLAAIKRVSKQ